MVQMSPLGDSPLFGLLSAPLQDELFAAGQSVRVSARDAAEEAQRRLVADASC